MKQQLTANRIRDVLIYDKETGLFVWRITLSNRAIAGANAGSFDKARGYMTIRIDGHLHQAHRLAWMYVTGEWPKNEIDHRDTDKLNNRIKNLRDVTFSENQQNVRIPRRHNTSGYLGVTWIKKLGKWKAQITIGKRCINLGCYSDASVAHDAYVCAKREYHEGNTL